MSPRRALLLLMLGTAPAITGCERLGRSLVDHFEGFEANTDAGLPLIVGCKELSCDAGLPVAAFDGKPLSALDRSGCDAAADLDAGTDDTGTPDDGAELSCTSRHLNLDEDPLSSHTLRDLRLKQVTLRFEASRPTTVTLEEPYLDRVAFTLLGPVALVIDAPRELREVQVRGTARPQGAPSLRIVQQSATALSVGSPDERFAGRVSLERVAVTDSQLVAEDVHLESTTFYDGLIDAAVVSTADADLDTVELRVGDGQIAAGRMRGLQVTRCGRLDLLGVESNEASFAACSPGPLRVYSSAVFGGFFDGPIESDVTEYSAVRFGAREATSLTMWSGLLERSAFCAHTRPTVFVGAATCVACEPEVFAEPGSLCDPEFAKEYKGNFCQAFRNVPECEAPPERLRPPQGRENNEPPPLPGAASAEAP